MAILTKTERPSNDLSYARIAYEQVLTTASVSAADGALIPNTFERWRPASGTQSVTFTTGSTQEINFIAIGAHNLGTAGATITIETAPTVSGTLTERYSVTPEDDKPILVLLDSDISIREVKITLTNGSNREIGYVSAGQVLVMPRAIYGGHSPITLNAKTEYQSNMTETGQFVGRKIIRKGSQSSFSWTRLDPQWYRDYFQPFVEAAKTKTFFIMWRPDRFSYEVAFGWVPGDISPVNNSEGTGQMDVSFNMLSHQDV